MTIVLGFTSKKAKANTNISDVLSEHFSWNNVIGWFDFYITNSINVDGNKLTGYAASSVGDVSLDCATTRQGNVCGGEHNINYGVCNGRYATHQINGSCAGGDPGSGKLSGWGWNQTVGWISFNCLNNNSCAVNGGYDYEVSIAANGDFHGYGWNPVIGWVNFNCADPGTCAPGGHDYKVNTTWRTTPATGFLESSIFDTEIQLGAILNSITWQGNANGGGVKFQIAVSNDQNGPWNYYGPGPNSNNYFEGSGDNQSIKIEGNDRIWVNNQRYLRYKVFLETDSNRTASPTVDNIILNWSR